MAKLNAAQRGSLRKIAYHETGHYIIGRMCGFEMGPIQVTIGRDLEWGGAEIATTRSVTDINGVKKYLEDRIISLLAGALAETLGDGHIDTDKAGKLLEKSAAQDHAKVREALYLLRNVTHPQVTVFHDPKKQVNDLYDVLWARAIVMLEGKKPAIITLSEAVIAMIQQTDRKYEMALTDINAMEEIKAAFP